MRDEDDVGDADAGAGGAGTPFRGGLDVPWLLVLEEPGSKQHLNAGVFPFAHAFLHKFAVDVFAVGPVDGGEVLGEWDLGRGGHGRVTY